jgi:ribosomal protein L16 Arg81 hydroxylase
MPVPRLYEDALAWLVAPTPRETFLKDHFRRAPFLVQDRGADHYAGLFSVEDLERLAFTAPDGLGARMQLVNETKRLPILRNAPLLPQMRRGVEESYSIQVLRLEELAPGVARLGRAFEIATGCEVTFNLYLSGRGGKVLGAHCDHHDAFVMQLHGTKEWRVYEDRPELVSASLRKEPPPSAERIGAPMWTPTLAPGDLLYMPVGRFHEADTVEEPSLHLTMGIYAYSGGKLLLDVLGELAATDAEFLEPVEAWPPDQRAGRLQHLLARLAGETDVPRRLAASRAELLAKMPVLPDGVLVRQALERADQLVEKRPGMPCRVEVAGEQAVIQFPGGALVAPARTAEALRFIAGVARPFRPAELPGPLNEDARLVLAKRLVKEGLLIVGR